MAVKNNETKSRSRQCQRSLFVQVNKMMIIVTQDQDSNDTCNCAMRSRVQLIRCCPLESTSRGLAFSYPNHVVQWHGSMVLLPLMFASKLQRCSRQKKLKSRVESRRSDSGFPRFICVERTCDQQFYCLHVDLQCFQGILISYPSFEPEGFTSSYAACSFSLKSLLHNV